jgi:hypothetical protein
VAGALVEGALVAAALVEGGELVSGAAVVSELLLQPLVRLMSNTPNANDNIILFIQQPNHSPNPASMGCFPHSQTHVQSLSGGFWFLILIVILIIIRFLHEKD